MLAALTKIEELAIEQDEAVTLGNAIATLAPFYNIEASAKVLAWGNMLSALGMVYGTRLIAIRARRATTPATPNAGGVGGDNVIDIPGVGKVRQ
jgi:hypothetical protein